MGIDDPSRRAVLKSLSMSVAVGSVLRVIPLQAAEHAHHMIETEKAAGPYTPKFIDAHAYKLLQALCDVIIPPDADSGGAVEGGAPEFIDLLASENSDYQKPLKEFLAWIDAACTRKYGNAWLECDKSQQTEVLNLVAYRKNAEQDASLAWPVYNFGFLRNFVADGFFTSKIGIRYLGYKGNTYLAEFQGCPPVPGV
jgi:gluconate 2-dehydrogenase gamma chain